MIFRNLVNRTLTSFGTWVVFAMNYATHDLNDLYQKTRYGLVIWLAALSMSLGACSTVQPLEAQIAPIELPSPDRPILPLPSEAKWLDVKFIAIPAGEVTSDDVIALSVTDFRKLARNLDEMTRWALQVSAQLRYYRDDRGRPEKGGVDDQG